MMRETDANTPGLDHLIEDELSAGDAVRQAARRALAFLSDCVEGQVADATVSDRIAAARALLEHAAKQPDALAEIANFASEDDVAVVLSVLD